MNSIMTAGGMFYTGNDFRWAAKEYIKLIPEFLADTTRRFTESKFGRFMETYDVLQNFDEFGNPLKEESLLKRLNMKAAFFLTTAGEHAIQTQLALAMTKSHRIEGGKIYSYNEWVEKHNKPVDKESKKEFDVLLNVHDRIIIRDNGRIWIEGGVRSKDIIKFTERIKALYRHLHGNYAKKDTTIWQRVTLGRLSNMFRRWLERAYNARLGVATFSGRDAFNQALGAPMAGRYTVTRDYLKQLAKEYKQLGGIVAANEAEWNKLPRWKKQLILQTIKEGLIMVASLMLVTAVAALKKAGGEPEEGTLERFAFDVAVYQAYRLKSELLFFIAPTEAAKIIRNPAATLSAIEKIVTGIYSAVPETTTEGLEWQMYEAGDRKGRWKGEKMLDAIPLWNQIRGLKYLEEKTNYMKQF